MSTVEDRVPLLEQAMTNADDILKETVSAVKQLDARVQALISLLQARGLLTLEEVETEAAKSPSICPPRFPMHRTL